ncbi:DUF72 domain-containing protein [Desulfocurvus sp. DL9XJH121]
MHTTPSPQRLIGLSGWNYADWKNGFYAGVKKKDWLKHYATRFQAVEVNATFYREQSPETFAAWREATPTNFRFSVKGHKYVTHMKRLLDPETTIPRRAPAVDELGDKLAALLWQLPAHCRANVERLDRFCAVLREHFPHTPQVMEFRHPTWFTDETRDVLEKHRVANCISDSGTWPRWDAVCANLAYLRLHGSPQTYYSAYDEEFLEDLAVRITAWNMAGTDVQVYFDNTAEQRAPGDAMRLLGMLGED